jgi:hypothetical protein
MGHDIRYHRFGESSASIFREEEGDTKFLRYVGMDPLRYTMHIPQEGNSENFKTDWYLQIPNFVLILSN